MLDKDKKINKGYALQIFSDKLICEVIQHLAGKLFSDIHPAINGFYETQSQLHKYHYCILKIRIIFSKTYNNLFVCVREFLGYAEAIIKIF